MTERVKECLAIWPSIFFAPLNISVVHRAGWLPARSPVGAPVLWLERLGPCQGGETNHLISTSTDLGRRLFCGMVVT